MKLRSASSPALFAALYAATFFLLSGSAWSQALAPVYKIGDAWTFDRIADDGPGTRTVYTETVESLAEKQITLRVDPGGARRIYSPYINTFDSKGKEIVQLKFPLAVGDTWKEEWDWVNKNGKFGTNKLKFEVLGLEDIVVPAGTFQAFKIEGNGFVEDKATQAGPLSGHSRQIETFWYAPSVKRIIKYEGKVVKWLPPNYVNTWFFKKELKSYQLTPE